MMLIHASLVVFYNIFHLFSNKPIYVKVYEHKITEESQLHSFSVSSELSFEQKKKNKKQPSPELFAYLFSSW